MSTQLNTIEKEHSIENYESHIVNDTPNTMNSIENNINLMLNLQHRPPQGSISEIIFNNDLKKLRQILKEPTLDLNKTDCCGFSYSWTPLYWGVKLRRVECIEMLLTHNVDINIVVNDSDECCGTVLDLVTLREDFEIENLLRKYAEKEDVNFGQSFKAIRTKLRGKAPAFNFKYYGKQNKNEPSI